MAQPSHCLIFSLKIFSGEKRKLVQKINNEIRSGSNQPFINSPEDQNCHLVNQLHELKQKIEENSNEIKRLGNGRDAFEAVEEKIVKQKAEYKEMLNQKVKNLHSAKSF